MTGAPLSADVHPAVASVVESRRLGDGQGARGTFTVARTRALLELRGLARPHPWSWTLSLVRAANVLSESPQAVVEREEEDDQLITRLVFALPGADFRGFELRDLLGAALAADRGVPLGTDEEHGHRLTRAKALIGRAINLALATERTSLEVLTPVGGRRFIRVEHEDQDRDPYEVRPIGDRSPAHSFAVRTVEPRPSVGRRFGDWISGRTDLQAALTELWRDAIVGADEENDAAHGMSLAPLMGAHPVALGAHARWWSKPDAVAVWLVRDGLKLVRLDEPLQAAGIDTRALRGWIECPGLSLTADETGVARDGAFELLVAWLHDLVAHTYPLEGDDGSKSSQIHWPTTLSAVPTASGYTLSLQALEGRVKQERDLVYVWCHQAGAVPPSARARVLQVWPSELAILEGVLPRARFVPLRALGTDPDYDRVDLTSLNQGSLEPLPLEFDAHFETDAGQALELDVVAYVHRFPAATLGAIVLLAYEREVAHVRDQRRVIPGLTLLCRIRPVDDAIDLDTLRNDEGIVEGVAKHCRDLADAHLESLLAHVAGSTNAWENPLVRAALEQLNAVRLGLRYVARDGGLRLSWDDSVLLALPIATARDGQSRTLRDLLDRCRDVGSVIEAPAGERWKTLESDDPRHTSWVLAPHARDLLARIVPAPVLMRMPVVADAYPAVAPALEQRGLLMSKKAVSVDLGRASTDPLARVRLLGHLLVARATGESTQGLERIALLARYDPRAAAPTRLVSLDSVLAEDPPPGLAFPGAVSRELAGPVLEVPPGVAALLHEVLGLEPESAPRPDASLVEGTIPGPVRKRSREAPPLVTHAVVHPLAIGSLKIAGDGSSRGIALWSRGLRIGEIHLPEPMGRVSGRLWLTRNAPHAELEAMTRAQAKALFEELVRQRSLLPPSGSRRDKLDAVVEYARGKVLESDPLELGPLLGIGEAAPRTEAALDRSLRAWPLQRLSPKLERWLAEIVIQSIGFRLNLDTAFLSWRAAKVKAVRRDGSVDVDLGRRNEWIQRALDVQSSGGRLAPFEASALVVAEFFHQARERRFFEATPADEAVAFWRLLALLVENVDTR